jgi:TRAP-type transport system periplasmic protein
MTDRLSRSRFVASTAASAFASIAIVRSPARAAQFDYKMAHGTPTNMAVHVRSAEMWDAVKRETNGAINVKIFPNNELGSELAQLSQLRSGALQFMIIQGVSLSGVVPGVSMDGLGFVFRNAAQAEGAYDGPLGAYLRKLIIDKGIFAFPRVFNFGMRQVTASSHPIRSAADFAGFKIRTPPAPISVDLFKTLGASPTPIVFPELYLALQTKVVDGQETPYSTIDVSNFAEILERNQSHGDDLLVSRERRSMERHTGTHAGDRPPSRRTRGDSRTQRHRTAERGHGRQTAP